MAIDWGARVVALETRVDELETEVRRLKKKVRGLAPPIAPEPDPDPPPPTLYTLAVGTEGNGEVTGPGIATPGDISEEYPAGTNVSLQPVPDTGSVFDEWTGSVPVGHETDSPLALVMDENKLVNAVFSTPPEPEPEDPDPVEDHWGAVIQEDLATITSAVQVWGNQSTAGYNGTSVSAAANDPYVQRIAETGTWIPHGRSTPSTHFRRLITPVAPPQAIYDSGVSGKHWPEDDNATTRAHIFRWSSSAYFTLEDGDHVWTTFGFRVMANPPLSYDLVAGGGNSKFTQVAQWKARNSSGYSEVDSISVGANGFKFNLGPHPGSSEFYDPVLAPHGVWHRVAVEQKVSSNSAVGYFRPWVKLDGESSWRAVGPKRFLSNIPGSSGWRNFGLGPYHNIRECTDNQLYRCDYRDVQVIRYV